MAVRFGAAVGAVVLTGTGCGGTLEGKYRTSSTTTRPPASSPAAPAGGAVGLDARAGEEQTP